MTSSLGFSCKHGNPGRQLASTEMIVKWQIRSILEMGLSVYIVGRNEGPAPEASPSTYVSAATVGFTLPSNHSEAHGLLSTPGRRREDEYPMSR